MNNKYNTPSKSNSVSDCNGKNNLYLSNKPLKSENKKLTLKSIKNNTISSLNEVECFLNKLQHTIRYIKLYKLLK